MAKRVLLTGGCGFIGRHTASELLQHGYEVRILDSLIEQVHGDPAGERAKYSELIQADVRDPAAVALALQNVDAVIHLAAEVGVGQSMYEIARYVGANDLGTAVLLEGLIKHPVERIVVASSMSVYGEGLYVNADGHRMSNIRRTAEQIKQGVWNPADRNGAPLIPVRTDEDKSVDLASIYALTKYTQEREVLIFGDAYDIDAVALRLFNVYGPGQALSNPYTGVLANFASRLANDQPPMIFEDGRQQRDFVHVRDVARAFRLSLEQPRAKGRAINIGSGQAFSIAQIAILLAQAMNKASIVPDILGKARAGDIRNCFADISLARDLLQFEPMCRLEHSLGEVAEWVGGSKVVDRGPEMKRQLEALGLVS